MLLWHWVATWVDSLGVAKKRGNRGLGDEVEPTTEVQLSAPAALSGPPLDIAGPGDGRADGRARRRTPARALRGSGARTGAAQGARAGGRRHARGGGRGALAVRAGRQSLRPRRR